MERKVIALRFEQKTQTEIAQLLGVPQMQVSRLLRRNIVKMRALLDQ